MGIELLDSRVRICPRVCFFEGFNYRPGPRMYWKWDIAGVVVRLTSSCCRWAKNRAKGHSDTPGPFVFAHM